MRRKRFKAEAGVPFAHYPCVSRVVDRDFGLGKLDTETFVKLMRRCETSCGVRPSGTRGGPGRGFDWRANRF